LAEVLITLGIIGIVAALTMPSLVANYQKNVSLTRLKKFVSVMRQANELALNDKGSFSSSPTANDADGAMDWWNENMDGYLKTVESKKFNNTVLFALPDGSGFVLWFSPTRHIIFCADYKKCSDKIQANSGEMVLADFINSRDTFLLTLSRSIFVFQCGGAKPEGRDCLKAFCAGSSGYAYGKAYTCAALIEYDGWEIKEDYPW
jgi:type II secretory pathway pseudopilin PulG